MRAGRFFTEKAPKPRSSTRSPRAIAVDDLVEDRVDDVLDVALIEMRILRSDALNQF